MEYNIEELLQLVKELTDSYTSKESTSITYEAAQQIMGAVLYCIHENTVDCEDMEQGQHWMANPRQFSTAREAYELGYQLVVEKIKKANELYNNIIVEFKDYGNRGYFDTIVKGIPEFFKWYDPRLNPMNHIILIDYPVLEPLQDLEGIDLIYRYLLCIQMETEFLKKLPQDYIKEVLVKLDPDYEELLINLCGSLIKKILVNMFLGVKLDKLQFKPEDYEQLAEGLKQMNKESLVEKLSNDLNRLITNIYGGDRKLYRYLSFEIDNIATELKNAAGNHCLDHII